MQLLTQIPVKPWARKHSSQNVKLRVGVVGYSNQPFDRQDALLLIRDAFDSFGRIADIEIVSGLTRLGIPALAYEEATRRGWKTIGVACLRAFEYPLFPVNEAIIAGNNWGDESATFIDMIDVLIRVGGGRQSRHEACLARVQGKDVIEFEIPSLLFD